MMEGLLKVDRVGSESDCLSEGTELFTAFIHLFYKWALQMVEEGEEHNIETVDGFFKATTQSDFLLTWDVILVGYDLLYRCNYGATMQGVLFNKMVVDTLFSN